MQRYFKNFQIKYFNSLKEGIWKITQDSYCEEEAMRENWLLLKIKAERKKEKLILRQ